MSVHHQGVVENKFYLLWSLVCTGVGFIMYVLLSCATHLQVACIVCVEFKVFKVPLSGVLFLFRGRVHVIRYSDRDTLFVCMIVSDLVFLFSG